MKTLDEYFPSGFGDGRKFTCDSRVQSSDWFFQPLAKSRRCGSDAVVWFGLVRGEYLDSFSDADFYMKFKEWHPPKTKKKVTMYMPIIKASSGCIHTPYPWINKKEYFDNRTDVCGWREMECEVDE